MHLVLPSLLAAYLAFVRGIGVDVSFHCSTSTGDTVIRLGKSRDTASSPCCHIRASTYSNATTPCILSNDLVSHENINTTDEDVTSMYCRDLVEPVYFGI